MFRVVTTSLALAGVIGVTFKYVTMTFGLPTWTYYIGLLVMAVFLYIADGVLTAVFISRRAPEFASCEEVFPGVQKWELTAGLGVVPKWVSLLGLASIASLLALLMPIVASLFR